MRIAIYHKSLWPKYKGAVFSSVHRLGQQRGVQVTFTHVAETDEIRLALGGVDLSYHEYPFRVLIQGSYEDASTFRRVASLMRDVLGQSCDLVVLPGYDRIENWAMLLVCMFLRRKRAVFCDSTSYDNPAVPWKSWAKRFFFSRCHGFIGYGQRTREYLVSLGAREHDVVVPCVAPALPHDYDADGVLAHYERQRPDDLQPPRFLYVGRLAMEKGLMDLLDAYAALRAAMPAARLDLVGEGAAREQLDRRLRALGLEQAVTFHGTLRLEQIAPLYMRSVALVLPSHREPWGLVANEALSYGCPVVVSDRCGCLPELLVSGVTGYGFEAGSVTGLAEAMRNVLRLSSDRRLTAGQCIRVARQLTPERAARRLLDGCMQLLNA
jgi:hypothetical protein